MVPPRYLKSILEKNIKYTSSKNYYTWLKHHSTYIFKRKNTYTEQNSNPIPLISRIHFYLHFKSWMRLRTKLMMIVQFISAYLLLFITFIKCTFPLNFPWLVSVKNPEFRSLTKFEWLHTWSELTSTVTFIFLVDLARALALEILASPTGSPL